MAWVVLIIAGLSEIVGVNGLQRAVNKQFVSGIIMLAIGMGVSLTLLSIAMKDIPLGVAYAVWTGIGTVGSVLIGMIFYKESKSVFRIACLACIIAAVIGLRIVTS